MSVSLRNLITPSIGTKWDLESLSQIHNAVYPVLFRYITFRVGDPKAAEQLTNKLFIHLLEEPNTHHEDPEFPQRLLLSLATKAVRTYQHQSTRAANSGVTKAKIREAMATLPETQQILLALRYGCRLTIEQVAQALDQSPEAVRHLGAKAIMALHAQMMTHPQKIVNNPQLLETEKIR